MTQVFIFNLEKIDLQNISHLSRFLSQEEKNRLSNMLSPKRQKEFILGHYLARQLLFFLYQKDFEITTNNAGAPCLKGQESLFINISHSHDCLAIAISEKPISIDIEKMKDKNNFNELLNQIDATNQAQNLINAGLSLKQAFYHLWTKKEANYKIKSYPPLTSALSFYYHTYRNFRLCVCSQDITSSIKWQTNTKEMLDLFLKKGEKMLLLSCCAPCSCGVIDFLAQQKRDFSVLFYNPNIRPYEEYKKRALENKRLCELYHIPFIELEYDNPRWCELTKGLEKEPEQGKRCSICFKMRLQKAFEYARKNGFSKVSSVLGVSRYKNLNQVNQAVLDANGADLYDMTNWRKNGLENKRASLIKELNLYTQNYCGCSPRQNTNNRKEKS